MVNNGETGATFDEGDWTLTAAGPTPVEGLGDSDDVIDQPVDVGDYTLSEDGPDGYDATAWTCVDAAGDTVTVTPAGVVAIGLGDDLTCTITNTAQPPAHPGQSGQQRRDRRHLRRGRLDPDRGRTHPGRRLGRHRRRHRPARDVGDYTLSEDGPDGYDATAWTCVDAAGDTVTVTPAGVVAIGVGDDLTCTITNTAQPSG